MKKIIFVALLLLACTSIVNAQIKIVGDDYSDSLTATKNYYDRDVDFDRFFPAISPREAFGMMESNLENFYYHHSGYEVNLIGDTLYLYKRIISEPTEPSFSIRQNGYAEPLNMPVGYYVIDGYVFCTDRMNDIRESVGLKKIEGREYGSSIKELKDDILTGKLRPEYAGPGRMANYINYIVLHSVDDQDENRNSYYLYPRMDRRTDYTKPIITDMHYFISVRFYNEARKFIGKEVVLTYGKDDWHYDKFEGVRDSIFVDELTHEKIKIQDKKYICKDIVMNSEGQFYAILNGEKTGSFAVGLKRVLYAWSSQDVPHAEYWDRGENKNHKQKGIACLMARGIGYIIESKNITILTNRAKKAKLQREKEEQQWESARKREKQQQEAAFEQKMTAKYGANFGKLVGKKKVAIGMSKEMCRDAWGRPMNTYRTTTKYGQSEVWCYNYKTRVYFYNGKVVQIDD